MGEAKFDMSDSRTQQPIMASGSTAQPGGSEIENTEQSRGLILSLEWPDIPSLAPYTKCDGWETLRKPSELSQYPEGLEIPDKLKEILTWSNFPGDKWATKPIRLDEHNQTGGSTEPGANEKGKQQTNMQTSKQAIDGKSVMSVESDSLRSSSPQSASLKDVEQPTLKLKFFSKLAKLRTSPKTHQRPVRPPVRTEECVSCFDELPVTELLQVDACKHWYCKECLKTLIMTAMASETLWPPKCCLSPLELKTIMKSLNNKQREDYKLKATEYAVPANERWYCPNTECLKWIPPNRLKLNAELNYLCPHCKITMCRACRGPSHPPDVECQHDRHLEATLETAEAEGWQRCYSCRALVEHASGCRHMTCKCRAEFCYVCGARWRTCQCTEEDFQNRREEIRQRRDQTAAVIDAEAEEIARAIAEVEEMELREAEERRLEEERIAREEEMILAALEEERRAQEIARIAAAEEAERQYKLAVRKLFMDNWNTSHTMLLQILEYQHEKISTRHVDSDLEESQRYREGLEKTKEKFNQMSDAMRNNLKRRRAHLQKKQEADSAKLSEKLEEEEDDLFLQIQLRLRGKPNKEARMERLLNELKQQQEEQTTELEKSQAKEKEKMENAMRIDIAGLNRGVEAELEEIRGQHRANAQALGTTIAADRQYFDLVVRRRFAMFDLDRAKCMNQIKNEDTLTGLLDWEAAACEPQLPVNAHTHPSVLGLTRGRSTIRKSISPTSASPEVRRFRRSATLDQNAFNASEPVTDRFYDTSSRPNSISSTTGLSPPLIQSNTAAVNPSSSRLSSQSMDSSAVPAISPGEFRRTSFNAASRSNLSLISGADAPIVIQGPHSDTATLSTLLTATGADAPIWIDGPNSDTSTLSALLASTAVDRRGSDMKSMSSVTTSVDSDTRTTAKKGRWSFSKKPKEISPEEMQKRLRNMVGDAAYA